MGRVSDARERLLKAALELVWQESYGAVTVDAICERAGVMKGSFYHFFDSKSRLAAEALVHYWDAARPDYDRMFSPALPPLERLRRYFEHLYERQQGLRKQAGRALGCPFFSVGCEVVDNDAVIREAVQGVLRSKSRYLETALRDAQAEGSIEKADVAGQARALSAFVDGLLGQARILDDPELLLTLPEGARRLLGAAPRVFQVAAAS